MYGRQGSNDLGMQIINHSITLTTFLSMIVQGLADMSPFEVDINPFLYPVDEETHEALENAGKTRSGRPPGVEPAMRLMWHEHVEVIGTM